MQELRDLERFEIETLNLLNQIRVLDSLYFGGGTMLRLCHNLQRYSTDLDFWMLPEANTSTHFEKILSGLNKTFTVTDAEQKTNTDLFEIKSPASTRKLVIEIRKNQEDFHWERKIAFSKYTNYQVAVNGLTLDQMMRNKVAAARDRKRIRDCYDIQFLLMRGINLNSDKESLGDLLTTINGFKDQDYSVSLGSLLEQKEREFHKENRFQLLREEIHTLLA